jgi:REP element-mobilizing transposase RayT
MSQSLSFVVLHIIFSTKNRERWIDDSLTTDLYSYIAGTLRAEGCAVYRIGGIEDHIHIACSLSRTCTISKLLENIKKSSSSWIKSQDRKYQLFAWQAGYGAFSIGRSQLPTLVHYIETQREHHKRCSFKTEFLNLLKKYQVDFDEKYLWI